MTKLSWQAVSVLLIGAVVGLVLVILGFCGNNNFLLMAGLGFLAAALATGGVKYTLTKLLLLPLLLPLWGCSTSIEYTSREEESTLKGGLFASYVNLKILGQELTWVNERVPRKEPSTRPSK